MNDKRYRQFIIKFRSGTIRTISLGTDQIFTVEIQEDQIDTYMNGNKVSWRVTDEGLEYIE